VISLDFVGFIQIVPGPQAGNDFNPLRGRQPFIVIWQPLIMRPN
jgi:hypothetical protein